MKEFAALRAKTWNYLPDNNNKDKKAKGTKKCKRKLRFDDSKVCLEATQLENNINQLEQNRFKPTRAK